jgi:hypothetical protein
MRTFGVGLAWLAAVAGALLVFGVRPGTSFVDGGSSLVLAGFVLAVVTEASVGAVLTLRRPGNVVGLVLMTAAILIAATLLGWSAAAVPGQPGRHDVLADLALLVGAVGFLPSLMVAGPLLALLFPDGRLPGPRWRWPVGGIVAAVVVGSTIVLLRPGPIAGTTVDSPLGLSGFSGSEAFWNVGLALGVTSMLLALLLALAAVIVRFRRAEGVERAQLKWFVAAIVFVGVLLTLGFADGGFLGLATGSTSSMFDVLAVASLSLPPIAVGVAILRYRLFEIDRIISRTLSWALVTGSLGAVFVGLVVGLQTLSANITGDDTLTVAASTLVVAALFQPLRLRVQAAVDRRFDRARYDAQRTVDRFGERLRDEVDLGRLGSALIISADDALSPATATVWLRGSTR